MTSHWVVEAARRYYTKRDRPAAYINMERSINAGLRAIEPALAEGSHTSIPPILTEVAYLDGVDIWAEPTTLPYARGEGATRVINDSTLFAELLELRDRFASLISEAADEQEAEELRRRQDSLSMMLLMGGQHRGLRMLGPAFDSGLLDARREFRARIARDPALTHGAWRKFKKRVLTILAQAVAPIPQPQATISLNSADGGARLVEVGITDVPDAEVLTDEASEICVTVRAPAAPPNMEELANDNA